MGPVHNKKKLYDFVDAQIAPYRFGKYGEDYEPLNMLNLLPEIAGLRIEYHEFENPHIGAMLLRGAVSSISLNRKKSAADLNFDCTHELIHWWREHPASVLYSFDNIPSCQNLFYEWEANEGAAQLLVPYQDFIPRFLRAAALIEESGWPVNDLYNSLAKFYGVNPVVIDYRIQNLDDAIIQAHAGCPIDKIRFTNSHSAFDRTRKVSVNKQLLEQLRNRHKG